MSVTEPTETIVSTLSSANRAVYPSLRDRRVLITGGGTGIGEVLVEEFVRQGARVVFVDVVEDASRLLVERLSGAAWAPRFQPCDLRDLKALRGCVEAIQTDLGAIDILINNAANDDRHVIDEVTPEYWEDRIAVNLRHVFFCTQAVIPGMRTAGGGAIVNMGSVSWHMALPDLVVYQTAKAGIQGMTRGMARDLGQHGIRVNCIVPGAVRTARQDALWHDAEENARILNGQCLKRRVMPADVAALALFLASDDARMCTGHAYFVDGGLR
jgi:D-xylose 1-dehydrogenase